MGVCCACIVNNNSAGSLAVTNIDASDAGWDEAVPEMRLGEKAVLDISR